MNRIDSVRTSLVLRALPSVLTSFVAFTVIGCLLIASAAHAKGGSNLSVSTSASATGTIVSGVVTITNAGSTSETITAIRTALEVRFPSGVTPPPLPAGSTSGWYEVAYASLPPSGPLPANSTRNVSYAFDTCGSGIAKYPGAKDMRTAAVVSGAQTYAARSLTFPLPGKCPVCGNGIVEAGEQCDQGYNGGACCATTCQFRPNGTTCNDGNACTQTDQCQTGSCVGSNSVTCTASDQCHIAGVCAPTTGLCSSPAKPNGTACDDQNACSLSDTCQSGLCLGSTMVTCTASDACHSASCNPATGTCSSQANGDGTECIDGDACTVGDHCVGGACISGAPRDCDDRKSCTADVCEPSTGCGYTATPTCGPCDATQCAACGDQCDADAAQCADNCWSAFWQCLAGCTSTYCAPFCQFDLGQCIDRCPATASCRSDCEIGNGCAAGCVAPQ